MPSLFKIHLNAFSLFLFVLRKNIREFSSFCRKIKSLHYPQVLQNASPIILPFILPDPTPKETPKEFAKNKR